MSHVPTFIKGVRYGQLIMVLDPDSYSGFCCMEIYKAKSKIYPDINLDSGEYHLDQNIMEVKAKLEDISEEMRSSGNYKWDFEDQRVFKVRDGIKFMDQWWECWLGVTNGKIFKIGLLRGGPFRKNSWRIFREFTESQIKQCRILWGLLIYTFGR